MVKATFFSCYSINLYRFIRSHAGIKPISKGINPNTDRTYWVFPVTDELSRILTAWTNSKKKSE